MANDLEFPRLGYRGLPDTLGLGFHINDAGEKVGETKRFETADEFEEAQKDGWRLTRDIEAPKAAPKAEAKTEAKADAKDAKK